MLLQLLIKLLIMSAALRSSLAYCAQNMFLYRQIDHYSVKEPSFFHCLTALIYQSSLYI